MKLGLAIGYSGAHLDIPVKLVQRAEELGYESVWTAEAYGSDAVTPLAFLAAHTSRIKLGTGIMQLAARTPANAAMSAATVDAMAGGGRFIVGLGVSGPQIVEGWYGQPWGKPYWRIRDYVAIMRKIFAREAPVTHDGREIALPYTGPGAMGIGKPLKSILHMNPDIPIFLATGNESTVKLTALSLAIWPMSASSTWASICTWDRSWAMVNNFGAWRLAATVCPTSTVRSMTTPSIGERIKVRSRFMRALSRVA
jgi:alkanesulfonate monooxygenase SsuD/methylene tetrahydromethanopterin reductase-like flavin-dependent oxidoreductase (luciferase family)